MLNKDQHKSCSSLSAVIPTRVILRFLYLLTISLSTKDDANTYSVCSCGARPSRLSSNACLDGCPLWLIVKEKRVCGCCLWMEFKQKGGEGWRFLRLKLRKFHTFCNFCTKLSKIDTILHNTNHNTNTVGNRINNCLLWRYVTQHPHSQLQHLCTIGNYLFCWFSWVINMGYYFWPKLLSPTDWYLFLFTKKSFVALCTEPQAFMISFSGVAQDLSANIDTREIN